MNLFARIFHAIRDRGLTRTLHSFVSVLEDYFFDIKYKTDTSEIVRLQDLDTTDEEKKHGAWYQATRIRHFRYLMKALGLPEGSVFVDLGSGKGRVLLIASNYNFKRVVGLEISSQLCEIARKNVESYEKKLRKSFPIEVVESDVLQYTMRDDEDVFYFYMPFDSFIMERFIGKITDSLKKNPRKVWLIINTFEYDDLFERERIFQKSTEFAYGSTESVVYTNS